MRGWFITCYLPSTPFPTHPPTRKSLKVNKARWSVAKAFPPWRFLNLILAHRGEVYIFNEARHQKILIGGNFSLYCCSCKGIFDFSWKYDEVNAPIFSNNTKNLKSSIQNGTGTFVIEKQYLQWKPHVNRTKWRRVTGNQRSSNFPPHDHIWSNLRGI